MGLYPFESPWVTNFMFSMLYFVALFVEDTQAPHSCRVRDDLPQRVQCCYINHFHWQLSGGGVLHGFF